MAGARKRRKSAVRHPFGAIGLHGRRPARIAGWAAVDGGYEGDRPGDAGEPLIGRGVERRLVIVCLERSGTGKLPVARIRRMQGSPAVAGERFRVEASIGVPFGKRQPEGFRIGPARPPAARHAGQFARRRHRKVPGRMVEGRGYRRLERGKRFPGLAPEHAGEPQARHAAEAVRGVEKRRAARIRLCGMADQTEIGGVTVEIRLAVRQAGSAMTARVIGVNAEVAGQQAEQRRVAARREAVCVAPEQGGARPPLPCAGGRG